MVLRPAEPTDAEGIADVWLRSFAAALPTVRRAHSDDEVRGWIREVLLHGHDVWVAQADGDSRPVCSCGRFQVNKSAQRFCERHGFVAAERTDGAANEEREPDVRYVWPGGHRREVR